ncbi:MAG: hypothetical protein QM709_00040 [Spongiibacteraceae bacterium]
MSRHYIFPVTIFLTLCIYLLGVRGPFILDDLLNLETLKKLDESSIPWYAVVFSNSSGALGRPVSMMTFAADYWLHGFNATWFKISNVLLHVACGATLYFLVIKALAETAYKSTSRTISSVVASIWLLSPFLTSTVLYVVQRMAILSALFTFLALLSYLNFRSSLSEGKPKYWLFVSFCIFSVLGIFSKENAALIPLLIFVLEVFFCKKIAVGHRVDKRWLVLVALVVAVPILLACVVLWLKPGIVLDYSKRAFTLEERFLTEQRIMWEYLLSLLLPRSINFGLFHDDIVISKGLFNPSATFWATLSWLIVLVLLVRALKSDTYRAIAGGVAFFLVGHILESTVLPLELYFEHRNYLPSTGAYLALVLFGAHAVQQEWVSSHLVKVAVGIYLVAFALSLSQRVLMWTNYELLIYSSYEAHPLSPRANTEAALMDAQRGMLEDAIKKIEVVKMLQPEKSMGANTQIMYMQCLLDREGLSDADAVNMTKVPVDDTAYTSTGLGELSDLYRSRGCDHVPVAAYIVALTDRIISFYDSGEYKKYNVQRLVGVDSINLRLMEGLNSLPKTQKSLELAAAINRSAQGGFGVDLLAAVALIDQGRMREAGELIEKCKLDNSVGAQLAAKSLANVEKIYKDRIDGGEK